MAAEDKKEYLVRIRSTEAEKLGREAKRLGIPRPEYIRRAVTGTGLPPPGTEQSIQSLLKINADLLRLGNLLRRALKEGVCPELEGMAGEIAETRTLLHVKIRHLKQYHDPARHQEWITLWL